MLFLAFSNVVMCRWPSYSSFFLVSFCFSLIDSSFRRQNSLWKFKTFFFTLQLFEFESNCSLCLFGGLARVTLLMCLIVGRKMTHSSTCFFSFSLFLNYACLTFPFLLFLILLKKFNLNFQTKAKNSRQKIFQTKIQRPKIK